LVSIAAFTEVARILLDRGFRFTVIGGTVVEYALGSEDLGDDLDLFAESPSVVFEADYYRLVAEENGWPLGYTWLGTPRVIVRVGDEEVPVEFYDNIHDFYIPPAVLERSVRVEIGGLRVKMVTLEDHIVLKANAGRGFDMDRLREIARLAKRGKLKVDRRKLLEAASDFEDRDVIVRRLREVNLLS